MKSSSKLNASSQLKMNSQFTQQNSNNSINQLNKLTQSNQLTSKDGGASKFMQQQNVQNVANPSTKITKLSSSNHQLSNASLAAANFPQFKLDLNQLNWLNNLLMAGDLCKDLGKESNNNNLTVKNRNKIDTLRQIDLIKMKF